MPIEVEMHDGSIAEFPDGTSPEVMQKAAQDYYRANWQPRRRSPADLREQAMRYERDNSPATEGISPARLLVEGAGKSVMDTGLGLRQLYANAADYFDPSQNAAGLVSGQDNSRSGIIQREVDARARQDDALLRSGWGVLGNVGGQWGQMFTPVGDAAKAIQYTGKGATALKGAVSGGAFAATQPVVSGQTRAENVAYGATFGGLGAQGARALQGVANGIASRLPAAERALAQKAEQLGIPLSASQLSNNPLVRTIASQMERLPFSGAGKANEARQAAFNREVGRTFGAPEDKITPDVFAKAKDRIGQVFDAVAARNQLPASPQLLSGLGRIRQEADRLGGSDTARAVRGWIDELVGKADANGVIPGAAYKSFDSRIGKVLKSGGEPAYYLGQVRELAREAMDRAISPRDKAAWDLARKQWASLKTVEPLVAKSTNGNISPQALMGRVTSDGAGKVRMAAGNGGSQGDLARIGQRFLRESPNSGTADRLGVNLAVGGGLYGLQEKGFIDPQTAAMLGLGLLGNRAGLGVLNSRALAQGNSRGLQGLARIVDKSRPQQLLPAGVLAYRKQDEPQR